MKPKHVIFLITILTILLALIVAHAGTRQNVTIEIGTYYSDEGGLDYVVSTQQSSVVYLYDVDSVVYPKGKPSSGTLVRCTIAYQYFIYFPLSGRYTVTIIPEN